MGDRNTFGRRLSRLVLGERLATSMRDGRTARRTRRSPDRRWLVAHLLPAVAAESGRTLWIGCRRYTDDYPARLESRGGECWTTDIDPEAATFGRKGRHRTGDVQVIDRLFADIAFDTVLCNGVFGYGVDTASARRRAMEAIARVLKPGGALVLGWNTDKIDDPIRPDLLEGLFEPCARWGLPQRHVVPGSTHVYDILRATQG